MKSTIRTLPLTSLVASPLNVRTSPPDAGKVAEIAASIAARGLIQPIAVHALKKPRGKFGVLAGRHRYEAILKLQADGVAFDFEAIPVNAIDGTDAELTEISLAENYVRQAMRPPEIYAAFRAIRDRDPEINDGDLAKHFDLEPARVARIMRLAYLHPTVFAAYDEGKLNDEQAFAFAATADQALQLQTYKSLFGRDRPKWEQFPREIRAAMKVGSAEHQKLLTFVGLDTYEAAGGRFEADLFAQEANSGRLLDEDILRRLVNEKLEVTKAEVIALHGDEVTFVDEAPKDKYGSSYDFRIHPRRGKPDDAQQARIDQISARLEEIEAQSESLVDDDGEVLPGKDDELAALEKEDEALRNELHVILDSVPDLLPAGPKIAVITIDHDGKAAVNWYREKIVRGAAASSIGGQKPELTDKAQATLKRMRANMFGRFLFETYPAAHDTRLMALDALIFSLAIGIRRNISSSWYDDKSQLGLSPGFGGSVYDGYGDETTFTPDLDDIPGLDTKDLVDGFSAYHHQATPEQKARLAAWVYYRKVQGELFRPGRRSIPEYIATALSTPLAARRAWQPTVTFFGLFKKDKILGWLGDLNEQFKKDFGRQKSADLKENAAKFFVADDDAVKRFGIAKSREAARSWIPQWLRWNESVKLTESTPASADLPDDPLTTGGTDPDSLDDNELEDAAE